MGFIRTNYEIKDLGITIPEAYAQISRLSVDIDGEANVVFVIQKDRESITTKENLDRIIYRCKIDKDLPVYKQIYENAKVDIFSEWEDDIIIEESNNSEE